MLTAENIRQAVANLRKAVDRWRESEEPVVRYRGGYTKAIDRAIEDAMQALFDQCRTMEVKLDARRLVLAVDRLQAKWDAWNYAFSAGVDESDPAGSDELWDCYEWMLREIEPKPRQCPEPIESLLKLPGITHRQIAKIYGWRMPGGEPDINKVAEEAAKPGRHFNPTKWVSPEQVARDEAIERQWAERQTRYEEQVQQQAATAPTETLDDLVLQGVSVKQIRKIMPGVSESDILNTAELYGVRLDGQPIIASKPRTHREREERQEAENRQAEERETKLQEADRHEGLDTLELRVLAMSEDGMKPGEISDLLEREGEQLTPQRIGQMIKGARSAAS